MTDALRRLPALNLLLERRAVRGALRQWSREVVRDLARETLAARREEIRRTGEAPAKAVLLKQCEADLLARLEELSTPRLRTVVNATGVLLHTNLGRARMAPDVAAEMARVAAEPVELEVDLDSGKRGGRSAGIERLLTRLTGADGAAVVNNGAAALWLSVRALVRPGQSVVVSRGEQVAIGGSFRMPELLRTTGAKMVEVGTTNRTGIDDYAAVVSGGDLVLKVHPSNYRIVGFHEEATARELAALCRERGATLVFDAGSGSLYNFRRFGLAGEPTLAELLGDGIDVVTCSADKLLGGPQAGLILGRGDLVRRCRKHPLMRALRLDKTILAALESTVLHYARTPPGGRPALPLLRALDVPVSELRRRARALAADLAPLLDAAPSGGWTVSVMRSEASMGAGSFANDPVASVSVGITAPDRARAQALHRRLRRARPAVLARIDDELVGLDLRAIDESELDVLRDVVRSALGELVPGEVRS